MTSKWVDQILMESVERKNKYIKYFKAGKEISGGYGFWNHDIMKGPESADVIKVYVDTLKKLGYNDKQIVLFGDFKAARHMADKMVGKDLKEMAKIITDMSIKKTSDVDELIADYDPETIKNAMKIFS